MILPMYMRFGQVCAQRGGADAFPLRRRAVHGMITHMETFVVRAFSCNSVFRYPSPFGWSCGVTAGSPIFSFRVARNQKTGESAVAGNATAGTRTAQERGTGRCNSKQHSLVSSHSRRLAHVATRLASKRSLAPVRAPQRPRLLAATLRRAPLSAAQPALSIAKNSPQNADLTAPRSFACALSQTDPRHKPPLRSRATVAFLLPMRAA